MTRAVANRYVVALADVLGDPGSGLAPATAFDQLQAFGDLLDESDELRSVLRSPAVSPREKRELVAAVGERTGMDRLVRNFLYVVLDHRRIAHFGLLLRGLRSWLDREAGRVEIEVRVASEIDSGQKAALERRFRELTGKRVRPVYVVDPALLSGSSVQVGSMLYDGSLRASLGSLSMSLASARR